MQPERLRRDSLTDQVTEWLYKGVMQGRYRPGERLNESDLARELGVSRNPIREAIRRLEAQGVTVRENLRGCFIKEIDLHMLDESFRFREAIEVFALEEFFRRQVDDKYEDLEGYVNLMEKAADTESRLALMENDLQFHRALCARSENRWVLKSYDALMVDIRLCVGFAGARFPSLKEAATDHWPLLCALKAGERERAKELLVEHIDIAQRMARERLVEGRRSNREGVAG